MSIYMHRVIKNRRGMETPTTEEQVRAALADPAQRAALIRRTNRTVDLLRGLIARDPRELAYVLVATEGEIEVLSAYFDLGDLWHWLRPAWPIITAHPSVREFVERGDRAFVGGTLVSLTDVGKGGDA